MRSAAFLLVLATAILGSGTAAHAQDAAVTMTPDRVHLLVNDQLGEERWSISMNLSSADPTKVVSVTGNVFRPDDTVSFVHCAVRPDSTGTLSDPSSTFRFTCRGTAGCADTALACARTSWQQIGRDVAIPASFFLPPDGLGDGAETAAPQAGASIARLIGDVWRRMRASLPSLSPHDAVAQASELAAVTMTPDLLTHLVVRDRSGQRWAIAFNVERDDTRAGGFKPTSVTGNIYGAEAAPSFVYCEPRSSSPASLEDLDAVLHFVCQGNAGCTTTAQECASGWTRINDDVAIDARFFLPAAGRGTPPSSDADLMLIGGTIGLPSIASDGYKGSGTGSCEEGTACEVDRIGGCENVRGRLTSVNGTCRCYVSPVAPACFRTGTETISTPRIRAACGDACSYEVGVPETDGTNLTRRIARGISLPLEADSPNCYCHANPPGRIRAVESCGGPEGIRCSDDRCCVDDPRDGCDPLAGDAACAGICIAPSEDKGLDAPTCAKQTTTTQFCGDGLIQGNEVCDPATSPAQTCASLGFSEGTLDCSGCVAVGCSDGNKEPEIRSLEQLPEKVDARWRYVVRGTFSDEDGDLEHVLLTKSLDGTERTYDVAVAGRRSGTFEVFLGCNGIVTGSDSMLDYSITLLDRAGNESEEMTVSSQCVERPLCGDGKKEGMERCDFGSDDPDDGCSNGRPCLNDCTCGKPTSCEGRCCATLDGFCGHPEQDCRCDPHCRDADRNDCCADVKDECGF